MPPFLFSCPASNRVLTDNLTGQPSSKMPYIDVVFHLTEFLLWPDPKVNTNKNLSLFNTYFRFKVTALAATNSLWRPLGVLHQLLQEGVHVRAALLVFSAGLPGDQPHNEAFSICRRKVVLLSVREQLCSTWPIDSSLIMFKEA